MKLIYIPPIVFKSEKFWNYCSNMGVKVVVKPLGLVDVIDEVYFILLLIDKLNQNNLE